MMSRSHQGMLSPPVKNDPTESKNFPIEPSIVPSLADDRSIDLSQQRIGISIELGEERKRET